MNVNINNVKLKNLSEKDVEQLIEIENLVSPYPWTRKLFFESIKSFYTISRGLFLSEKLVGFIFYTQIADEITIENIAVHPEYQYSGYGSFILQDSVLKLVNSVSKNIYLEVRTSNKSAIKFYEKHGFIEYSKRKNYYTNKNQTFEDAILMKLSIKKKKKL